MLLLHGLASNMTRWSEFVERTALVEQRDVVRVDIEQARHIDLFMLFDPGHSLDERVIAEQFRF